MSEQSSEYAVLSGLSLRRLFFRFQAEDGIRDSEVTGVETCALTICLNSSQVEDGIRDSEVTGVQTDRKSTRLNSSHLRISYAVFCLKKKTRGPEQWAPRPADPARAWR